MSTRNGFTKALQIVFKALLLGPLLFAAIVIFLVKATGMTSTIQGLTANVLLFAAIAIAGLSVLMAYRIFSQKLEEAKQKNDIAEKLDAYRAAYIAQLAFCEGPAILSIICYFITANTTFLVVLLLVLLNFARLYPTKPKIIQQLQLDDNEASMVE